MLVGKLSASVVALLTTTTTTAAAAIKNDQCSPSNIKTPSVPNAHTIDLSASPVSRYPYSNTTLDFCNVTVTYSHIGWDDRVHVTVWMPFSGWSGRLQGSGGGEYAMRNGNDALAQAVATNYSVVATDGGHQWHDMTTAKPWALDENNNVNLHLLKDFASVGLSDAAIVGKDITKSFYGNAPKYSYWNGCSTGGRQGLMLAQRYPTAYDGILAEAPAINWPSFLVAEYWPQLVMNELGRYPHKCITDAITAAAIRSCDPDDGVVDGVISAPHHCKFDPFSVVGQKINCNGQPLSITKEDAVIAQKTWEGMRSTNGSFVWYGLEKGSALSREGSQSLAATKCSTPTNCTGLPFPVSVEWIKLFVLQDPSMDVSTLNQSALVDIFHISKAKYETIIGTNDPDLSDFKEAGGKMVTWHGLSDELIFQRGTEQYYNRVEARDSAVRDYYRFFQAPGVYHCGGGYGPIPTDPLKSVVRWVEEGVSPDTLSAVSSDKRWHRNLCVYPLVPAYQGGDPKAASSYVCQEDFD
jgi:hypothetical protein